MTDVRNGAGLGVHSEAGSNFQQGDADNNSLVDERFSRWTDPAFRESRAKQMHIRNTLELSWRLSTIEHSERWLRTVANDLVRQGFDTEYVACRYGITPRKAVAA